MERAGVRRSLLPRAIFRAQGCVPVRGSHGHTVQDNHGQGGLLHGEHPGVSRQGPAGGALHQGHGRPGGRSLPHRGGPQEERGADSQGAQYPSDILRPRNRRPPHLHPRRQEDRQPLRVRTCSRRHRRAQLQAAGWRASARLRLRPGHLGQGRGLRCRLPGLVRADRHPGACDSHRGGRGLDRRCRRAVGRLRRLRPVRDLQPAAPERYKPGEPQDGAHPRGARRRGGRGDPPGDRLRRPAQEFLRLQACRPLRPEPD